MLQITQNGRIKFPGDLDVFKMNFDWRMATIRGVLTLLPLNVRKL